MPCWSKCKVVQPFLRKIQPYLPEIKYASNPNPSHSTLGHISHRNYRAGSQEDTYKFVEGGTAGTT